jgi:hypothetical protein
MDILKIEGTDDTPQIVLDPNGSFEISGRSMPEDVAHFYQPVFSWLETYLENPAPKTEVHFRMHYFNTASSKMLMDVMIKLEEIKDTGPEINIYWHFPSGDDDMKEAGEEYADMIEIPFQIIEYQK